MTLPVFAAKRQQLISIPANKVFAEYWNNYRYHESLSSVILADVYYGRDDVILIIPLRCTPHNLRKPLGFKRMSLPKLNHNGVISTN
jgi:hypothetical protein